MLFATSLEFRKCRLNKVQSLINHPREETPVATKDSCQIWSTNAFSWSAIKAKLDFWKFFWGSVFAAIVVASVPPFLSIRNGLLRNTKKGQGARAKSCREP